MTLRVTNAHNRIDAIRTQHTAWLQHLAEHTEPEGLPATISIQGATVTINCYGHAITADPKVVSDGHGLYAMEYIFYAREGENEQELWRLYLTSNGRLEGSLEQEIPICDFDNPYVAKHICGPVMYAALDSFLFMPTERPGG